MNDVVEFLDARIAEDEDRARDLAEENGMNGYTSPGSEIKRRIIRAAVNRREDWVLHMLAQEYSGHPTYRPEWGGWQ